jgi:hypothetical protein
MASSLIIGASRVFILPGADLPDTVFNNADWTVQQFLTGSFSTAQVATGGN